VTGSDAAAGLLAPFLGEMARVPWFESCGAPLGPEGAGLASAYAASLGIGEFPVEGIKDWRAAQALAQDSGWNRGWWEAEKAAEKALHLTGIARHGRDEFLASLTDVTEAAASIQVAASRALSRSGIADQGLGKAAAGAASQACHQAALLLLAAWDKECQSHMFARKFRLYAAGRWPLGIVRDRCFVF
jgi:hypothetical protein